VRDVLSLPSNVSGWRFDRKRTKAHAVLSVGHAWHRSESPAATVINDGLIVGKRRQSPVLKLFSTASRFFMARCVVSR
jgi:hypothetical protein